MKKLIFTIFISVFFNSLLFSQAAILWEETYGGSYPDEANSSVLTNDGGYALLGSSWSNNGDVSGNHGGEDIWVVKLNQNAQIEWEKCLGGSSTEAGNSIQQTNDNGFIIVGYTISNDGDVSGLHGHYDAWVVKLDQNGNIEWQRCYGGSSFDEVHSILQTNDEGYIMSGSSASNDGDVSGNNGEHDAWVVKIDQTGAIEWQNCYGGSGSDGMYQIVQTNDNGFIMTGVSNSIDGDVSGNQGEYDIWLMKIDQDGNMDWQKCFGGSGEEFGRAIQQTNDGGYVFIGYTNSNNGDISGNHGNIDIWIVKLNQTADIEWQKCLGGSGEERGYSIHQENDGGYIISGHTYSNDGDVTNNYGSFDIWLVKLNQNGILEWQKNYGGSSDDRSYSIHITGDEYVVTGYTNSNDGDISNNNGSSDFWIFGLCQPSPLSLELSNPNNYCYYTLEANGGFSSYEWSTGESSQSIDVTEGGTYYLTAINSNGCPSEAEITIADPEPIPIEIQISDDNYCYSTELTAIGDFNSYLWNTGETDQVITISEGGDYSLVATGIMGCQSTAEISAPSPAEPFNEAEICMVTLNPESNKNIIIYEPFYNVGVDSVRLYRLNNQTSEYIWMGSRHIQGSSVFIDYASNPSQQSEQYKIAIRDTCGKLSELSSVHRTILLQANTGINGEVNLFWNAYEGLTYPNFGIYRKQAGGDYFLIANVPNNIYTFIDTYPPSGELEYQIRVEKDYSCYPVKDSYSFSGSNPVTMNPVGTHSLLLDDIKIMPNPFSDRITINRDHSTKDLDIELLDIYGRVLANHELYIGEESTEIPTKSLAKGVYYLRFDHHTSKQVIKQ